MSCLGEIWLSTTLFACDTTPCISYRLARAGCLLLSIPSTDTMAGLRPLPFASRGVVLSFHSYKYRFDLSDLFFQSASLLLSIWNLGRKMGQCNTHSSPEGDVVIGQLFEGLLVKCKWSVASKCQRQLCSWLASPSSCEDDPSKL